MISQPVRHANLSMVDSTLYYPPSRLCRHRRRHASEQAMQCYKHSPQGPTIFPKMLMVTSIMPKKPPDLPAATHYSITTPISKMPTVQNADQEE